MKHPQEYNESFIAKNIRGMPLKKETNEKIVSTVIAGLRSFDKYLYRFLLLGVTAYITMKVITKAHATIGFEVMLLFLIALPMVVQRVGTSADKHDKKIDERPLP